MAANSAEAKQQVDGGGAADVDTGSAGKTAPDPEGKARVSLAILGTAKAAQAAHGLKHGDFARYRQYCTRRLLRVRRAAGLTQGRGRYAARPVSPDDAFRDARALLIPLVTAERAWAAAMETKKDAQAADRDGGSVAKARRRVILKLRRAAQAAETLRVLCVEVADEQTVFEAEAYAKWMAATLDLENDQWAKALAGFEIVARVYTGIIAMCDGSAAAGVFEERAEEVKTAIRFCRYHLARSGEAGADEDVEELLAGIRASGAGGDDMLAQRIDMVLVESRKKAAKNLGSVHWCGSDVLLRTESVREAVLEAEERSKALQGDPERAKSIDAYDGVFIAYNDAIQVVKKVLGEFREASFRADDRVAELERLVAYLTYGRIKHTVARNLLLVKSFESKRSAKPEDFVRLYDNLIQNMTDILGLNGVDEDASLSNDTEARKLVFRAHRCFHLAECYRVAEMLDEASALYDKVGFLTRTLSGPYAEEARNVVSQSRGMKCRVRANEFIKQAEAERELSALSLLGSSKKGIPRSSGIRLGEHAVMLDHLDSFVPFAGNRCGSRTIIDLPPALEAVPCKPVLFDLAIDGVKFPEQPAPEAAAKEADSSERTNGSTSTTSTYFSRWFSSSK